MSGLNTCRCYELKMGQEEAFYTVSPRWLSVLEAADGGVEVRVSGSPPGDRAWTEARMKLYAGHQHSLDNGRLMAANPTALLRAVALRILQSEWEMPLKVLESALWGPLDRGSYQLQHWRVQEPAWRPVYLQVGAGALTLGFEDDSVERNTYTIKLMSEPAQERVEFTLQMPVPNEMEALEVAVGMPAGGPCWLVIGEFRARRMFRRMRFFDGGRVKIAEFGSL